MRARRLPVLRVRLVAIGLPLAVGGALLCARLLLSEDEAPSRPGLVTFVPAGARAAPAPGSTPRRAPLAPGSRPEPVRPRAQPPAGPARVAQRAPVAWRAPTPQAPARPAWLPEAVHALSQELRQLDRLAAQTALTARFAAAAGDPGATALLHQVDDLLDLGAWARYRGQRAPDPADALRPTVVVHSLEPAQVQERARRARNARRRDRAG